MVYHMVLENRQFVSSCVADLLHACHTRESEWPVKVPANSTKLEHLWLLLILCVSCWLWERNLCIHEYVYIYIYREMIYAYIGMLPLQITVVTRSLTFMVEDPYNLYLPLLLERLASNDVYIYVYIYICTNRYVLCVLFTFVKLYVLIRTRRAWITSIGGRCTKTSAMWTQSGCTWRGQGQLWGCQSEQLKSEVCYHKSA